MAVRMRSRRLIARALIASVLVASVPGTAAAVAPHAAVFAGTVTEYETGVPLGGIDVEVWPWEAAWAETTSTPAYTVTSAPDGTYEVTVPSAGPWILAFVDRSGIYRDMTFPQRGLPVQRSYGVSPTLGATYTADASLVPLVRLKAERTVRVAGADRYATAVQAVRSTFPDGLPTGTLLLASGEGFADALCASFVAHAESAPLLLTARDSLPPVVAAEIERLKPSKVIIIGGTAAVSEGVADRLKTLKLPSAPTVTRIAGSNRYDTAAQIVYRYQDRIGEDTVAFVCRGDSFADALSAAPHATTYGYPILLTQKSNVPAAVTRAWNAMSKKGADVLYVMGGTAAVEQRVIQEFAGTSVDQQVSYARIAGADRYETSAIATVAFGANWPFDVLGIANGDRYPDALAGGIVMGMLRGSMLLSPADRLPAGARIALGAFGPYVLELDVYGGTGAISAGSMSAAHTALGTDVYDVDEGIRPFSAAGGAPSALGAVGSEATLHPVGPAVLGEALRVDLDTLELMTAYPPEAE